MNVETDWDAARSPMNEARRRAEGLKEFRLKWLEEPVWPPENYDGLLAQRQGPLRGRRE